MLGPHSIAEDEEGKRFIELTQIKSGSQIKIPLPDDLYDMLMSLPVLGQTGTPVVLKRSGWTIVYGTQFWFWTAQMDGADINQVVESAAKNWSDDVTAVLKKTVEKFGKFVHHSTPHTFRHTFACFMLNKGRDLVKVAGWLGDTPEVVMRHYAHANKDWHSKSHDDFMEVYPSPKPIRKAKVVRMKQVG
jgi:integrase